MEQKTIVKIDGHEVPVVEKEIFNANIIKVRVGTNGYKGGDSGHGSRTVFSIENLASTDMNISFHSGGNFLGFIEAGDFSIKNRAMHGCDIETDYIEIEFGGDAELDTFIQALEFAVETLKKQVNR